MSVSIFLPLRGAFVGDFASKNVFCPVQFSKVAKIVQGLFNMQFVWKKDVEVILEQSPAESEK